MDLSTSQQKRLEKLAKMMDEGNADMADYIFELEDKIDEEIATMKEIVANVEAQKGDTPTDDHLTSLIKPLIPQIRDGEDYVLTEQDKAEIASKIKVPVVDKVIEKAIERVEVRVEQPNIVNNIREVALPETPNEVVDKINKSKKKIKGDRIDIKIKNYDDEIATLQNRTQLLNQMINNRAVAQPAPDLSGYVPYTNATQDLDMTAYALKVKTTSQTFYDDFDVFNFGDPVFAQKRIAWSNGNTGNNWLAFLDEASGPLNIYATYYGSGANLTGIDHNTLSNLTVGDVHTQYAYLLGRSGGQTLIGGTASGNNLTLQSTSHATKGKLIFGTSAYDEVNNRLGIATATPLTALHVVGQVSASLGSVGAPTYSFIGDLNTGMYSAGADILRLVTAGVDRMTFAADGKVGLTGTIFNNSWGKIQIVGTGTNFTDSPVLLIKHSTDDSAAKNAGISSETRMTSRYLRTWQNIGNNDNSFGNAGVINWTAWEYSDAFITLATPTEFKGWNYQYWNGSAYKQLLKVGITGVGIGMSAIGTVPSAKLHVIETTEQVRVGYDTSNYYSTTVGSTGGVTFNAVGSGSSFTFSDSVNITSSLQCDSIVNDTGLAHGTYTPTLTGVTNVASSTARQATYMRVGNTVTVAGQIDVTPTANNARTTIGVSLPIASNFSTAYQAGGSGHTTANTTAGHGLAIYSDATNDRVEFDYYETHGALDTFTYQFSYEVI
jgi:hypothetical protein